MDITCHLDKNDPAVDFLIDAEYGREIVIEGTLKVSDSFMGIKHAVGFNPCIVKF